MRKFKNEYEVDLFDRFASHAMMSLLKDFNSLNDSNRTLDMKEIAEVSYEMAIMMMEERKKYYDE